MYRLAHALLCNTELEARLERVKRKLNHKGRVSDTLEEKMQELSHRLATVQGEHATLVLTLEALHAHLRATL